jgi:Ca2+-binding RTX toxin-like protein
VTITTIDGATSSDLKTLKGTELADTFTIEGKNQYIEGLAGADTVTAASGLDNFTIDTGADNDTVTLSGEAASVLINLQGGNDKVSLVDALSSTINGGDGSDTITHGATRSFENGTIFGRSGNDDYALVNVINSYIGGDQDDDKLVVTGDFTNSTIRGGNQKDTITLAKASGIVKGDNNEDAITVTGTASALYVGGDAGIDTITISSAIASATTVRGGKGNDDINISSAAILVKGDDGADDIDVTSSANHTIYGGTGADAIDSNSTKALFIDGEADKDVITLTGVAASSTAHTVAGGTGNDSITGTTGIESIDGGTDADTIVSAGGNDTIYGRAGADVIQLNAAGTVGVWAGADNDVIEVTAAQLTFEDTIKGDTGTDSIALVGTAADFDMTAANTVAEKSFNNISTVETLALGTKNSAYTVATLKTITLSAKAQTTGITKIDAKYAAGAGDDDLAVNASTFTSSSALTFIGSDDGDVNVVFTGGSGNDTLTTGKIGTAAGDSLTGGDGLDTFNVVSTTTDTEIEDLGKGGADVLVVTSAAKGVNADVTVDWVATSATKNNASLSDVVLTAASGIDINVAAATGNFGYDINGGSGASTLQGSSLNDSIDGGAAADSIVGNAGNDTINAAAGNDSANGGDGNDTFTYTSGTSDQGAGDVIDGGSGTNVFTINAAVTASSVSSAEFDFDNISNLLTIQTSGIGDDGENQTVVISDIAETTAQTVVINGSTLNSAADSADLVVTNNADSATTVFSITGGSGADTLVGSNGKDIITGGDGADTITGGAGADAITFATGSENAMQTGGKGTTAQSVAWTAEGFTEAALGAGETMTFGNGIDVYSGWTDGGDTFTTGDASMVTLDAGGDLEAAAAEENFQITGAWDSSTNVFTQADAGADSLVLGDSQEVGITTAGNAADFFIVTGSATLTADDFV